MFITVYYIALDVVVSKINYKRKTFQRFVRKCNQVLSEKLNTYN